MLYAERGSEGKQPIFLVFTQLYLDSGEQLSAESLHEKKFHKTCLFLARKTKMNTHVRGEKYKIQHTSGISYY